MNLMVFESRWRGQQDAAKGQQQAAAPGAPAVAEADIPAVITTTAGAKSGAAEKSLLRVPSAAAMGTTAPLKGDGPSRKSSRKRSRHHQHRSSSMRRSRPDKSQYDAQQRLLLQQQRQIALMQQQLQQQQKQLSLMGMQNVLIPSSISIPISSSSASGPENAENNDNDAASQAGTIGTLDLTVGGVSSIGTIGMSVIEGKNDESDSDSESEASFYDKVVRKNELRADRSTSKKRSPSKKTGEADEDHQQEDEEDLASQGTSIGTSMGTIDATLNCGASSVGSIGTRMLDGLDDDGGDNKDEKDDDESEASFFAKVVRRNKLVKKEDHKKKDKKKERYPTSVECAPRQVSETSAASQTKPKQESQLPPPPPQQQQRQEPLRDAADADDGASQAGTSIATLEFSAIGSIGSTPSMTRGLDGVGDADDASSASSEASFFHKVVKRNKLKGDRGEPKKKKQKTSAAPVQTTESLKPARKFSGGPLSMQPNQAAATAAVEAVPEDAMSQDGLATIGSIGTMNTFTFLKGVEKDQTPKQGTPSPKDNDDDDDASQASFFAAVVEKNKLMDSKPKSSQKKTKTKPAATSTKADRKASAKASQDMDLLAAAICQEPIAESNWGDNDVPLGRRKEVRTYIGNVRFRQIIDQHRPQYQTFTRKAEKTRMAKEIFFLIKHRGGRFLDPRGARDAKGKSKVEWFEITPDKAQAKISQALRNGTRPLKSDKDTEKYPEEKND